MKVAINVWLLRKKKLDGIGEFIKETMSRLIKDHPDVEFLIMCDKGFSEDYFEFPNATKYFLFPALRHPALYVVYMESVVPMFLKKHKPDVFIAPEGILSLSSSCKQIACIHDLNFLHYPENLNFRNRVYYTFFGKRFADKATRIATVSEYSKSDIIKFYGVKEEKIDLVYSGIKPNLHPINDAEKIAVKAKFSEGKEYFFFVGSLHPRKNIVRLMQAFDLFKEQTKSDMKLVLAGNFMWSNKDIKEVYDQLKYNKDILLTGWITDEELNMLYGGALAITFVATFEGFGLPVLEAFSTGAPLICSNVTSLPEIAGDGALLVDPFSVPEIKDAMVKVFENKDGIRQELIKKGEQRVPVYSWQRTADLLWESVLKTVKQ